MFRFLCLFMLLIFPTVTLRAQGQEAAPRRSASPEEITAWVNQLDSNLFLEREEATNKLIAVGAAAVPAAMEAIASNNMEVAMRAAHVLKSLALHEDHNVSDTALSALERSADSPTPAVVRRADVVLNGLRDTMRTRASEQLTRLGATITINSRQLGFVVEDGFNIKIGEDWKGTNGDLRRMKWLGPVQSVSFVGAHFTDESLRHLAGLTNLAEIRLKKTAITDDGLVHIKQLPRLSVLWLMYVPITEKALDTLIGLQQLTDLKLYGTEIPLNNGEALKAAMKSTRIDLRNGGFLGVGGGAHELGFRVSIANAPAGSAAVKAGVLDDDILTSLNGESVQSFEDLTLRISQYWAGDEITLGLVRFKSYQEVETTHLSENKLGLTGKPHEIGCEVVAIEPGSILAQSGVRKGDIITVYKRTRIFDPEKLQALFDKNKPGETPNLSFVSGPQLLSLKAKLGEWE